ncbi:uncharacterized protein LOC62_01G000154 [Vanrija pseudolonga]|uniref:Uncharacterized protein n=1 Tax=Vanrija pseudolonga TaxID=143232 RepID=A0AAF1BEX3_9TREE|nr:hypothetical protein LOC62_01G000154 [Vanrija pseudolonga]
MAPSQSYSNTSVMVGGYWPIPLPPGYAACTTNSDDITDVCCLRLHGAVYTANTSMPYLPPSQQPNNTHQCLLIPRDPALFKPNFTAQVESWDACANENKTVTSMSCMNGAGRRATLGLAALVWMAVGCVLVV